MDISENPNYYFIDRPYKPKLICFGCRKVFKHRLASDLNIEANNDLGSMICPNCGKKANYIGPKFRAPKSDNIKAWKSIETLNDIGVLSFIGWASNRIKIPESNKGLTDLLTEMKTDYENAIRGWISRDYNEENKLNIKKYSDAIKRIGKYLEKL